MPYNLIMWPRITRNWTLSTINHEPDPYWLTLARSTNHEPDRCCLRLVRSTYHGSYHGAGFLWLTRFPYHQSCTILKAKWLILNSNFKFQFLIKIFNFHYQFLILIFNFDFQFKFLIFIIDSYLFIYFILFRVRV